MSEGKFTPGPWEEDAMGMYVFTQGENRMICEIRGYGHLSRLHNHDEEKVIEAQKANAALIADAPALLDALRALLGVAKRAADGHLVGYSEMNHTAELLRKHGG